MEKANRLFSTVVGGMILICTTYAFTQDWPQWRGVNRDGKVTGFNTPANWPDELVQKWKVNVGTGDATPAFVVNRLYVFTRQKADEVIVCLNADNGKELWRQKYAARAVTGPAVSHPGPRSSPTVAQGKVITLGVGGVLECLDATTGELLWRKDEFTNIPTFFTAMSPIILEGACIVHLGAKDSGMIVAFDLTTGKQKWQWSGDMPTYSSPMPMTVGGTKQLVVQTADNLLGISAADGKLLWEIPTPPQRRFYNSATPLVDGQTVIYTGQGNGTKSVKVEKQGESFVTKELWSNEEIGTSFNTPVLKDGLIYGISSKRRCVFCLNAQTGRTVWADNKLSDRFGSILDAGSVMLAVISTGELIAFEPDNKGYSEIARIKIAETPIYAHPVIVGNRIYIKDRETLALLSLE